MVDWATQMADVDASVDAELGDEFQLSLDGLTFTTISGFAYPPGAEIEVDFAGINPIAGQPRVMISKLLLAGAEPDPDSHRFIVPQLAPAPTKWRPENWASVRAGRYWMIDLQKAVT